MTIVLHFVFVVIGFLVLAKSADVLVDGSSSIARRYNVSDLVIGLTIVAFGTSAPELIVSVISSIKGNSGIAIGNVVGSNIANLGLVLGGAGIIAPIVMKKATVRRDIPFCIGTAGLLLLIVALNRSGFVISRLESVILLAAMLLYMALVFSISREPIKDVDDPTERRPGVATLMIVLGLVGLMVGGEVIVRYSVKIATHFKVSQELIGVTIVAIGTSLPELAAAIAAVLKNKSDIAIGNVVGSNIFNTGLVLGTAGAIAPISSAKSFVPDALAGLALSVLLLLFMLTGQRRKLDRWEAILMLVAYAGYLTFAVVRG
jgi:cation:H+ antiporter